MGSPFSGHKLTLRAPHRDEQLPGPHTDQVAAVLEGEDLGQCTLVTLDANGDVLWADPGTPPESINQYIAGAQALYLAWQRDQEAAAAAS